ncbi:MAG: DUF5752 family protein [Candidatus Nanoarchaeia archaeon]
MKANEAVDFLSDVHPEKEFRMHCGKKVKNLREMRDEMDKMDDHIFQFHVNDVKNDFAEWVHHAIGDHDLAHEMRKTKHRQITRTILNGRIFHLTDMLRKEWLKKRVEKWEVLDFALGILVGVGVAILIVWF